MKNVTSEIKKVPQTPVLPNSGDYYSYSKTQYGNNYQIMGTLNEANTGIIPNSFAEGENTKVIDGNYNGLVAYTFTGGVQYLVALPSLMTSTGSDMIYGDTKNFLYENDSNQTIDYTPASIWRGVDLPDSIQDRNAMMDNILRAYEESSVSLSNRFKDIAQGPDSIAYNKMGQIILRDYVQDDSINISKISRQCDVGGGDVRQDLQGSTWGECYRVSCYAGFNPVGETDCVWSNSGFTLSANNFEQSDEPLFTVKNIDGVNMFYQEGKRDMFTSGLIPVDTNNTYKLTGEFKNLGSESSTLLFGLKSYDENQEEINAWRIGRGGNAITVASFDDLKISGVETPTGWIVGNAAYHQKAIGIYYDGDTTKLPDYVFKWKDFHYSHEVKQGGYSDVIGNDIMLTRKIPDEIAQNIIPGTTKVMNHRSGGTYLYYYQSTNPTSSVSNQWETRSGQANGEEFSINPVGKFRTGTKYVRIHILANHNGNTSDYKMGFDNIKFEELP